MKAPKTHYIYKITHLPSGRYYYGKRSCNGPWTEDNYMGSGKKLKCLMKKYPASEFEKEVLLLLDSAAEALLFEKIAVGDRWKTDPLCINLREGGEGVRDFWDLPENREAQSDRKKKLFEDPAKREAVSQAGKKRFEDPAQRENMSAAQKKRYTDPAQRELLAQAAKKRFEDPAQRAASAERSRRRFSDPAAREAAAAAQKKRYTDPAQRAAQSVAQKKRFADPAQREAREKHTVRLSKGGVIYEVNKTQLLTELSAGAVFCGNTIEIYHLPEGVWIKLSGITAKHLLLLDAGWQVGGRRQLEKITLKHVDKATGRVLPRV